ncbi:MAG: DUF2911 domain-containing protein [Verrucomicrobiota bacterium]
MKRRSFSLACGLCSLLLASALTAQNRGPALSPRQVLAQEVGTTTVTIDYGRPGVKDREIFGGLVPFGEPWRTGANASTKLTLEAPARLGDLDVPAGEYALYTIPGEDEWTIILSKHTEGWGTGGHSAENELGRFTVEATTLETPVETFTINFSGFDGYTATMHLDWDDTRVAFVIETFPAG